MNNPRSNRSTKDSWKKYKNNLKFLSTGTSTMSKRPRFEPEEPCYIDRGEGCRVWDIDGNEYIDFRNALGPVTLGYRYLPVEEAIHKQLKKGIIFGHPTLLEGEVAELIVEMIPCAEKVRYLKTGGEAVAAAIKLARAVTGCDMILQCGYNGWLNSLASGASVLPRTRQDVPLGIPLELSRLHRMLPWGEISKWEEVFEKCGQKIAAAVITMDYHRPELAFDFLPALRKLTKKYNALLIIDEIVTGFRIAVGGLHEYTDVDVDLAIFSKGIANGMPLSVVAGKAEIMDTFEEAVVSSTFSGETLSLAAAKASLLTYKKFDVIGHIKNLGARLKDGINSLFERHNYPLIYVGLPACSILALKNDPTGYTETDEVKAYFRAAYKNGMSLYAMNYINFSCKEADIDETLDRLSSALSQLTGK